MTFPPTKYSTYHHVPQASERERQQSVLFLGDVATLGVFHAHV